MRLLHTSDWHLGRSIYGRKCNNEFKEFLDWLITEIEKQQIDCLLITGDIFDTTTPNNTTQSLYYSFLYRVTETCCRHVIITGGNHDSPSLLDAPAQLLKQLHVQVIGSAPDNITDEILTLYDASDQEELLVCAVPYLRDRDIRKSEAGESLETKAHNLIAGIQQHYRDVVDEAIRIQESLSHRVPLIATGHLFAAGGKIADNNEIRDLYIGSLAHIPRAIFPTEIDYLALGHLHIAQQVDHCEHIGYCGSPLQLSFGKENSKKSITIIDIAEGKFKTKKISVPRFLKLESIQGDYAEVMSHFEELIARNEKILVEIIFHGSEIITLLNDIEQKLQGGQIELLRTVNKNIVDRYLQQKLPEEALEHLNEMEVFRRCLDANGVENDNRTELEFCFSEVLQSLEEEQPEERER